LSRRPLALLVVAAASLLAACGGGGEQGAGRRSEFFGVNAQFLATVPAGRQAPQLEAMHRGGLEVVRWDAHWAGVEPEPPRRPGRRHLYRWRVIDAIVLALARHHLRWYPIVDYSAPWAASRRGQEQSPPAGDGDYAAFARALAARYGREGSFWRGHADLPFLPVESYEIWNEPNTNHFWQPQAGAPERYASLYRAARAAIRGVDPNARVVVGGLTTYSPGSTPVARFLARMTARLGGLAAVDAVAVHPYESSLRGVYRSIRALRRALDALGGGGVPLDVTEVGWPTLQVSDRKRGRWLAALARNLPRSDCKIGVLLPHTWLTPEADHDNPEDWFGIVDQDATWKPSARAYLGAVRSVEAGRGPRKSRICH